MCNLWICIFLTVIKVHAYCSQLGVSLHAVIWVLLASFVGFPVAMLYLIVLLIYKLCMRVIEQVALAGMFV